MHTGNGQLTVATTARRPNAREKDAHGRGSALLDDGDVVAEADLDHFRVEGAARLTRRWYHRRRVVAPHALTALLRQVLRLPVRLRTGAHHADRPVDALGETLAQQ